MYVHSEVSVRLHCKTTNSFKVSVAPKHDCSVLPILLLIYVGRLIPKSESYDGTKGGDGIALQRLLFEDDLVLLDSTQNVLQQAFDRFSGACCVAGMKISTIKTETMCLSRQLKQCSFHVGGYH